MNDSVCAILYGSDTVSHVVVAFKKQDRPNETALSQLY